MTERGRFFTELTRDKPFEPTDLPDGQDPLLPGEAAGEPIDNPIKRTSQPSELEEQTPHRRNLVGRAIGSIAGRLFRRRNRELPAGKEPIALGSTPAEIDASLVPDDVYTDADPASEDIRTIAGPVAGRAPGAQSLPIELEYTSTHTPKRPPTGTGRAAVKPSTGEFPAQPPAERQIHTSDPMQTTTPPIPAYREWHTAELKIVPDTTSPSVEPSIPLPAVGQYWVSKKPALPMLTPEPKADEKPPIEALQLPETQLPAVIYGELAEQIGITPLEPNSNNKPTKGFSWFDSQVDLQIMSNRSS